MDMTTFQKVKLGDLLERKIKVEIKKGLEYSFVPMENVDPGSKYPRIIETKVFNGSGSKFADGDTLFARITPCLQNKKIAKVKNLKNGTGFGSTEFFILRAKKNRADSDYLHYVTRLDDLIHTAILSMVGASGRQRADLKSIYEYEVNVPDLPSQTCIASVLSTYDDLIENNEKRIKALEEMAQLLHTEWFVKFKFPGHEKVKMVDSGTEYGMVPEGWEVKRLKVLTKYISRGLTPIYDDLGKTKVLNQKCIRNHRLSLDGSRSQSRAIPAAKQLYFGDILINSTGVGTLGRVTQVYKELQGYTADTHITIVRAVSDEFIDYLGLATFHHQDDFERLGAGATGQTELSRDSIGNLALVLPPLNLVTDFSQIVRSSRLEAIVLQNQNRILGQTRDLLIPQLVTGKRELK